MKWSALSDELLSRVLKDTTAEDLQKQELRVLEEIERDCKMLKSVSVLVSITICLMFFAVYISSGAPFATVICALALTIGIADVWMLAKNTFNTLDRISVCMQYLTAINMAKLIKDKIIKEDK